MANIDAGAFLRKNMEVQAFETKTVDATAGGIALTAGTYTSRRYAIIMVENAEIRVTLEGTAPTSAIGGRFGPDDVIELYSNDAITKFRAIRTGSVSAVLQCFYGEMKITA